MSFSEGPNKHFLTTAVFLMFCLLVLPTGDVKKTIEVLTANGFGAITTEIHEAPEFYYAEDYHQQYLSKRPSGYCGLGGTGVSCSIGGKE